MNKYITLDSKKYSTSQDKWIPTIIKPGTVRLTLDASVDASYGPGVFYQWIGEIRADSSPASGYGSPEDLKTTLAKRQGVSFIDHLGDTYNVHITGDFPQTHLIPQWDNSLTFFQVRMIGISTGSASPSPTPSASPSPS